MFYIENFIKFLNKKKINFFTGVPDSILKELNTYINHSNNKHILASNEGSAIAIAAGYHLSTNKIPAVYMQNSGFGNAINPLISVTHKKVYSIPSLLIIGWRGSPGLKDEPQHLVKGLITRELLKLMGIKFCVIENEKDFIKLSKLINFSKSNKVPVACLIKKNTIFTKKKFSNKKKDEYISRNFFIKSLLKKIKKNTKIFSTTGYISRELFNVSSPIQRKNNFYVVGGMGHCSMIALGYSLFVKKKVLCLDGDGSMLMHFGSIFTLGQNLQKNFKYILLNNNIHESVGMQKTNVDNINLRKIFKGFKFDEYFSIKNNNEFKKKIDVFLNSKKSSFLEVRISSFNSNQSLSRPNNFTNIKKNFMK